MIIEWDPGCAGEWLAAVGLNRWGQGRWTPNEGLTKWTPWHYEYTGDLPATEDVAAALEGARSHPAVTGEVHTRWLNHRGAGTPTRTINKLLDVIPDGDMGRLGWREPRTKTAGGGWEICTSWARHVGGADPGRPIITTALAFLGALSLARWDRLWIMPSVVVGHLWTSSETSLVEPGRIVVWSRSFPPGASTAGPFNPGFVTEAAASGDQWEWDPYWYVPDRVPRLLTAFDL